MVSRPPVPTLEIIAECIGRDPASWRGISLLYLRPLGDTPSDELASAVEQSLKDKSDILAVKGKNDDYLLLGQNLAAGQFKKMITGYCLIDNIAAQSEQACAVIGSIAIEKASAPIERHSIKNKITPSILIVEDEPMTSKMAAQHLKQFGTVIATSNSRQATANYNVRRPDLVFLDIHYQDDHYDGFDVLSNLLSTDKRAFIIMVSGDRDPVTILKALSLGAQGFITKPFRAGDFAHYLAKFTSRQV